ncbi:DEAD/DEAH box helicase family protein [Metabacillus litoralis]|uniref:DEAD/DEAH box helicase family protein n=1 Tax=Metabacillus litoralis TaxID=152268 RepID=UPI001CFC6020|nr:DEAD/DEAH box helicase family protein [Metabacillus litoralis]
MEPIEQENTLIETIVSLNEIIPNAQVLKLKGFSRKNYRKDLETSNLQHYAAIHQEKHYVQPDGTKMAIITNAIKRIGHASWYSPQEILEALSDGHCVLLSNFEVNDQNSIRFISASAFTVDIDDNDEVTEPIKVLNDLKDICMGLFYTFSHGKKGNRYRLVFQLDQSITDLDDYKVLVEDVMDYLKNKGLPIDESAKSPTQVIRPGMMGYEVNDFSTTLPVNEWLPKARLKAEIKKLNRETEQKARAKRFKDSMLQLVTFDELKEMCKTIGYIPSDGKDGTRTKWLQIVYALKNEVVIGNLNEKQGYELYCIISGSESSEQYWDSIKPRGEVGIGSIIKHAKDGGYKRKYKYNYAWQETSESIPTESIKVKEHLTIEVANDLIQRKQRLLVDSPTGSRKTSSFIGASKELASKDWHYYIFTAPTIPLTEQIAKDHNIPCALGGMKNLGNEVTTKAINGERVFVSTYDKAEEIIRHLTSGIDYGYENITPQFTVIIDEIHKFTDAYNYRFAAIDQIKGLAEIAVSFIGLSGTSEDVLKDHFDKLIKIDTGNSSSPCLDYRVFTYEKRNDADIMLIPVIRGLLQQTKVMLFINSKQRIKRIKDILRMEGIKTQVVTSDSKQSSTYLNIVENGTISDDVQVVISTSVLADGVSINNDLSWSCLVVSDMSSPFFNPSTVKQISNRFRGQYQYFGLYMQQPNPKFMETNRFYIETDYQYRKKIVRGYVEYLNQEFNDCKKKFLPSLVEKENGIFYRSQDENAIIEFNPLFVRHQSMKRKERYYTLFRNAFIEEVGNQLGVKCSGVFNVNEEVEKNGFDLSRLLENMKFQQKQEKKENAELREAFSMYFDESMYQCFLKDDEESLKVFKKQVHPDQFAATKRNVTIADYKTCKTVGKNIKRKADINKYFNHIKGLADIAAFDFIKKITVTKKVFKELLKMTNERYSSNEFKDIIQNKLRKTLNVQASDVKAGLELFHESHSRSAKERFTQIKPLTVKIVASANGLSESSVKNSVLKYVWQRNGHQQKILLQAILEKWGIEKYQS